MKKFLLIVFMFFVSAAVLNAQPNWTYYFDAFELTSGSPGTLDVTIGLRANTISDEELLANSTVRIDFSTDLYGFGEGNDPQFLMSHIGDGYTVTVTDPGPGDQTVQVNIFYDATRVDVLEPGIRIATLRFFVENTSGSSNLVFHNLNQTSYGNGTSLVNLSYDNSNGSTPLPVELSSFTAENNRNKVMLNWQTETEVDNYGFEVERKLPGSDEWQKITFIPGSGNSNSVKQYSYVDSRISGGSKFIYRLKQLDNSGEFSYSDEVEVEVLPTEYNLSQNYPNPFNPYTKIDFSVVNHERVNLSIYNMLGEKVQEVINKMYEPGFYSIQFNGAGLASGMYIYRIQTENFSAAKRMMLLK